MINNIRALQVFVLLLLCLMATGVNAAEESIAGVIRHVNTHTGVFTLSAKEGGMLELRAPAALLANLKAGDAVHVRLSGTRVTAISKQEDRQPPRTDIEQRLRPPIGTERPR